MIVLGIDPGYALMGWGVVEAKGSQMKLLGYGCIETKAGTPMQHRLRTLQLGIRDLTLMYRPDEVAFEELFFAQNVTTALMVGAARGAAIIAAAEYTEFIEITAIFSRVIENSVENYLYIKLVRFLYQRVKCLVAAEHRVNLKIVSRVVFMV